MRRTLDLLESELSGARARTHVEAITRHYRSPGSAGFHAVIDYIAGTLSELGIDATVRTFPLDGRFELGGEPTPRAWEPGGATLELLPDGEVLVTWEECPSCIPWWCRATPAEGVELEVVDVGTGESEQDYAGTDVEGRAVLIHDARENFAWSDIVARATRHGAAAIVSNYLIYQYAPWRTRAALPDAVQQMRLPAHSDTNPWTFCVSDTAFQRVLDAARAGPAVGLRLTIAARTFESSSRSVLATIPGTSLPGEGILIVSHVSAATMPGANCASGVALGLELVQTITRLIAGGRLEAPRRSIHFLFANEGYGSIELAAAEPAFVEGLIAAFAFCSVGHDQGKTKSTLVVGRSLDALPTFVDDIVEALVELRTHELPWAYRGVPRDIPYVRWKVIPYTPWSDNATWSRLGVPGLLFMSLPDRYFHTQLLTVQETDPHVFVSCGAVTGAAALLAAAAGTQQAGEIMRVCAARAARRLDALALEALAFGPIEPRRASRLADAVGYLVERDLANLRTALTLAPATSQRDLGALADRLAGDLTAKAESIAAEIASAHGEAPATGEDGELSRVVPRPRTGIDRLPHGIPGLDYAQMVELAGRMGRRDPAVVLESLQVIADSLWSRCDGTADIAGLARGIGHEFDFDLAPADIQRLTHGFERAGFVELTNT